MVTEKTASGGLLTAVNPSFGQRLTRSRQENRGQAAAFARKALAFQQKVVL